MPTIRLDKVGKIYTGPSRQSAGVLDVDLTILQGEFVFITGGHGAGKSTLIDILAGEIEPDRGRVYLGGVDVTKVGRRRGAKLRACMGMVLQDSELDPQLSVYQNMVAMERPHRIWEPGLSGLRIVKALSLVGMDRSVARLPAELTPSERRRVQLAQAIVYSPSILLLDGLTEGMDGDSASDTVRLLAEMNDKGTTVVTTAAAGTFAGVPRRRVLKLEGGRITSDVRR